MLKDLQTYSQFVQHLQATVMVTNSTILLDLLHSIASIQDSITGHPSMPKKVFISFSDVKYFSYILLECSSVYYIISAKLFILILSVYIIFYYSILTIFFCLLFWRYCFYASITISIFTIQIIFCIIFNIRVISSNTFIYSLLSPLSLSSFFIRS